MHCKQNNTVEEMIKYQLSEQ